MWCGWCAASPSFTKEKKYDRFADHCGGLCHVLGHSGAAVRVERKEHALCDVRFSAHRAGHRRGVVRVRGPAAAGPCQSGRLCAGAGVGHRRHPSGRLRRHLRCPFQLWRPRKKTGDLKRPPLRCFCGHPAVQLFSGLFCPVHLRAVHAPGGRTVDAGTGAGTHPLRLRRGSVPHGKKHRPCPYLRHRGRQNHCAPGADRAGCRAGRRHDVPSRLGTGAGRAGGAVLL